MRARDSRTYRNVTKGDTGISKKRVSEEKVFERKGGGGGRGDGRSFLDASCEPRFMTPTI